MSINVQDNQVQATEPKSDKENNFALIRKQLEQANAGKQAAEERAAALERQIQERSRAVQDEDDERDDEPYVDKRKLSKTLSKFGEQSRQQTQQDVKQAVQQALAEERRANWLKSNPDFYEVMTHVEKFAQKDPELAETILEMPDGFERQKLVYRNIKSMGLHKKEEPAQSIQQKIDANRRTPYYQPSGVGSPAYSSQGDFSDSGKKNAYTHMQELKNRIRL